MLLFSNSGFLQASCVEYIPLPKGEDRVPLQTRALERVYPGLGADLDLEQDELRPLTLVAGALQGLDPLDGGGDVLYIPFKIFLSWVCICNK